MFSSGYKYCDEVSSADNRKDGLILFTGIRTSFLLFIGRTPVKRTSHSRELVQYLQ